MFIYSIYEFEYNFKSKNVADAVYASNWIKMTKEGKINMLLVMQRAQKAQHLQACGFFIFSLPTYSNVSLVNLMKFLLFDAKI